MIRPRTKNHFSSVTFDGVAVGTVLEPDCHWSGSNTFRQCFSRCFVEQLLANCFQALMQSCERLSDGSPFHPLVFFSAGDLACTWLFHSKRFAVFVLSTQRSLMISYTRRDHHVQYMVQYVPHSFRDTDLIVGVSHGMKSGTPTHLVSYQRG